MATKARRQEVPDGMTWEDPPSHGRGRIPDPCWEAMRSRPGQWARLPLSPKSVSNMRRNHPEFDLTVRTIDGDMVMFGRYVGNGKA